MNSKSLLKGSVSLAAVTALLGADQASAALDELIVTARKRNESLQDIPLSVQAFSGEAIAKQGIKDLEDYARLIPSLTYSSWLPGSAIVVFRGVTPTGDSFGGSSSSALYMNEMPIAIQGLNPQASLVDMERLEAVSGPQPTTYGASAQSGVLKMVTNKPVLDEFSGNVDISGVFMEEGETGYDFSATVNIPLVEDKLALRVVGYQSKEGGYVDNISGSSSQTHDYSGGFEYAALSYGPDGPYPLPTIVHKDNHAVAEEDIGDIDTQGIRLSAGWQLNDDWRVDAMYQYQTMDAEGVGSWEPHLGDLNQIRFKDETKSDDWYLTTLVIQGDLGFADFTAASGYMDRQVIYSLDSSTYLHQFQGVGAIVYNSFDIYTNVVYGATGMDRYNATVYWANAYSGSITGWENTGFPGPYYETYRITELTDNTSISTDDYEYDRFSQELRLTSKDEGQRYQWMVGAFYEKYEDETTFRAFVDGFGESLGGHALQNVLGRGAVRSPAQSWWSHDTTEETQWAVFGEFGFDITSKFNVLVGARYFDAESEAVSVSANADGFNAQGCKQDIAGDCLTKPGLVDMDNRLGLVSATSSSKENGVLPLVTLTYTFNEDIMAYYTRAEGFRTGGANLLRSDSTAPARYDSDSLISNEIGLKTTLLDGRLVWNASYFQMVWEDIQMNAADPTIQAGWTSMQVNAGEAEIDGFETSFQFEATDNLTFDGALSYIEAEVTEAAIIDNQGTPEVIIAAGEELPLSPDLKFNLGAEYSFPVSAVDGDGYVRFDFTYVDEQTNATSGSTLLTSSDYLRGEITTLESYEIGNLKVGVDVEDWGVSLAVNNLWDERAITYKPTRWTDGRVYSNRPREFVVNFYKNF